VGTTNIDGEGASGLEMRFDESLQGAPGKKRFIKDLHGDAIRDIGVVREAADGESLQLSIDLRLQHAQHRELHRAMKETGAAGRLSGHARRAHGRNSGDDQPAFIQSE
jgi:cell division protein FtsI (penicillin-binding protein 3)